MRIVLIVLLKCFEQNGDKLAFILRLLQILQNRQKIAYDIFVQYDVLSVVVVNYTGALCYFWGWLFRVDKYEEEVQLSQHFFCQKFVLSNHRPSLLYQHGSEIGIDIFLDNFDIDIDNSDHINIMLQPLVFKPISEYNFNT